jgi:hypothetical protein
MQKLEIKTRNHTGDFNSGGVKNEKTILPGFRIIDHYPGIITLLAGTSR